MGAAPARLSLAGLSAQVVGLGLWLMLRLGLGLGLGALPSTEADEPRRVNVYQLIHYDHGLPFEGVEACVFSDGPLRCAWYSNDTLPALAQTFHRTTTAAGVAGAATAELTVAMYNIHTLWHNTKAFNPHPHVLPTQVQMIESQESHNGYSHMFDRAFPKFDGFSTTSPKAHVQRIYDDAYFYEHELFPLQPFAQLIKAATFLSSHCMRQDKVNSRRDDYVVGLRRFGFRVDGLGQCLTSLGPGATQLPPYTGDTPKDLIVKRQAISKYLFNLAFENQVEDGYVTEKVFDALRAGIVPVYLGDASHCRQLLPDPKAAIFVSDFGNNAQKLAQYLNYLSQNETAYEEHRDWRKTYNSARHIAANPHLKESWHCKVCHWASTRMPQ